MTGETATNDTPSGWTVAALYKFAAVDDAPALRTTLYDLGVSLGLCGTLLVAPEGINGTVAGSPEAIAALKNFLDRDPRFAERLSWKISGASKQPFRRWFVKLKREIVTLRAPEADPAKAVGRYVKPEDWNALIARDDVTLVDTRNTYEVEAGTFAGAVDPGTTTFPEFPEWVAKNLDPEKHPRVAMFCTGGIRCEKASSLLLARGFREVYHLEGGILKYLETVPENESAWRGSCFVFDDRKALGHGLGECERTPAGDEKSPGSEPPGL